MGERLLCKQEVIGSIPFTSTTLKGSRQKDEEGDRRLIQIPERSQVSPEAYFWSFDRRGCSLFNNSKEASALISQDRCMGCDCIDLIPSSQMESGTSVRIPVALGLRSGRKRPARGFKVIGSSEQVHMVDALAITGDEGRSSLR